MFYSGPEFWFISASLKGGVGGRKEGLLFTAGGGLAHFSSATSSSTLRLPALLAGEVIPPLFLSIV
jgi:hypothetical protein